MTILFNIIFAGLLFCAGVYHAWNGNWTNTLMLFTLILILHNAAGGYKAAMNTVHIFRLLVDTKNTVEQIKRKVRWLSDSREVK